MKISEPRPKIAEPERQPPVKEPLMLTTLELVDRAIRIEWATTLKAKPHGGADGAWQMRSPVI